MIDMCQGINFTCTYAKQLEIYMIIAIYQGCEFNDTHGKIKMKYICCHLAR